MDQRIINLYDEYTHKPLSRDEFIKGLTKITGSLAAAMTILPLIETNYAHAAVTRSDELMTERISYDGVNGRMSAYVARPKKDGKYATIMVIHENRGLNPHIEDVARRAARAGYLAIAPDALAPQGGTPENQDQAREMFGKINAAENLQNFIKGFEYVKTRKDSTNAFGCV
ncbi:MAG TPA: dienelactone hydrolase family protein, partial [Chitinophagaceae bacterium]|nr:dienelactone hydrolase family protein [Chitinophagaceae bacterium]